MADNLNDEARATIAQARQQSIDKAIAEFEKIDKDGNNVIDRNEVKSMFAAIVPQSGSAQEAQMEEKINKLFESFDSNGDGVISKEEWIAFFADVFDNVLAQALTQEQ